MIALALPAATTGEGFVPPTTDELHLPDVLPWAADYGTGVGKQMILVLLSVVIIAWFFSKAAKKQALVPSKLQLVGEMGYGLVRDSIGKDIIGQRDFLKFVPLLFTVFFFVLVNNIYGAIPLIQLPSFSHPGSAYVLAGIIYVLWITIGIRKHGIGYFKMVVVPSGVPWPLLIILIPIEIISNFLVRPITHSLRLFATMMAGHLIVLLAGSGIEYLLVLQDNIFLQATSVLVLVGGVAMYMLEALIMVIQAYVFTLLTAIYIQGALADEH
ncbi:ATP synthase subunit A [Arthrobacter sp. RIT-PI-e]|uniref:F0F1 ATP synthase subunit A n=1 Tax=Arthrobacter sp. RIT-PI-e TaxID=1681197 RepID=UPI0006768A91|nr:F0F1 ATP synthase subunit A [Arthrobacter sp. RIT-PI-e]KNC18823.1 ATP synthase subunit A [Arthrobacter sp. RIT-PI-e]